MKKRENLMVERELRFRKISAFICVPENKQMDYQSRDGPSFLQYYS